MLFQFCWPRLLQLCRRRSEEFWWTQWAVATPGDEGVGRLPSRSKWGRYRPKRRFFAPSVLSLRRRVSCFFSSIFFRRALETSREFHLESWRDPLFLSFQSGFRPLEFLPFFALMPSKITACVLMSRKPVRNRGWKTLAATHAHLPPSRFLVFLSADRQIPSAKRHIQES